MKNPRSRTGAPYPMTHEVPFGLLDLSNPQTVAWMESIIAAMALSAGVDPTSGRPRVQVTPPPPPLPAQCSVACCGMGRVGALESLGGAHVVGGGARCRAGWRTLESTCHSTRTSRRESIR